MEHYDVSQFLSTHPLLGDVDDATREQLISDLQIAYVRAGRVIEFDEVQPPGLLILRSGSVEVRKKSSDDLVDQLSVGDMVPVCLLHDEGEWQYSIHALEDSLYYYIDQSCFEAVREREAIFKSLYSVAKRRYHKGGDEGVAENFPKDDGAEEARGSFIPQWRQFNPNPLALSRVSEYMRTPLISVGGDKTIEQAACLMNEHNISSLVIIDNKKPVGILTDKDFRRRVLSQGVSVQDNIKAVMSPEPVFIRSDASLHEAQLLMMSHEIHHLIVKRDDKARGMITSSDILKASNLEPLPLLSRLKREEKLDGLIKISSYLPELVSKLIERNTRPSEVGQIITAFSDALTRRLAKLALHKYGEPPCKFTWLAFGSQARQEQMIGSDQDNALITERELTKEEAKYFAKCCKFINDGLDKCGFVYCPGDIMASNPKWRMSLEGWKRRFDVWIDQPEPMALMHSSIFFDMRAVVGDMSFKEELQAYVLKKSQANTIFLAYMATNALQHRPPLGFFKNFVLDTNGEHAHELDLKKRGTIPIVDIARNYALANGLSAVNTIERLRAMREQKIVSVDMANSLIDAHEFIARRRLMAQAKEQRSAEQVDNYINPKTLSPLQRQQLKEAFQCVRDFQQIMNNRFNATI